MKIARFEGEAFSGVGLVRTDTSEIEVVGLDFASSLMLACSGAEREILDARDGRTVPLAEVRLVAPLVDDVPGMYCVGANYAAHEQEIRGTLLQSRPEWPVLFFKRRESLADPDAVLPLPESLSSEFDWEVELGVVIGRSGRDIPAERAYEYVAGYCIVNDVTARDLQQRHQQWFLGKNVEGSTPLGPWVLTRDSRPVPPSLTLDLAVNGAEKQRGCSDDLIFDIPELVSTISAVTTLRVGDIIATGTPEGVGYRRTPPEFLRDGDLVEATIEELGSLSNKITTVRMLTSAEDAR